MAASVAARTSSVSQNLGRFEHAAQRQQPVGAGRAHAKLVDQPPRKASEIL